MPNTITDANLFRLAEKLLAVELGWMHAKNEGTKAQRNLWDIKANAVADTVSVALNLALPAWAVRKQVQRIITENDTLPEYITSAIVYDWLRGDEERNQ